MTYEQRMKHLRKIKPVSMLCVIGLHNWILKNAHGIKFSKCLRCGRVKNES